MFMLFLFLFCIAARIAFKMRVYRAARTFELKSIIRKYESIYPHLEILLLTAGYTVAVLERNQQGIISSEQSPIIGINPLQIQPHRQDIQPIAMPLSLDTFDSKNTANKDTSKPSELRRKKTGDFEFENEEEGGNGARQFDI